MSFDVDQLFQQAVQHHQAGRLSLAEAHYLQVLLARPDHADALHLLGVLAFYQGRYEAAANAIQWALVHSPGNPTYQSSMAGALASLHRPCDIG